MRACLRPALGTGLVSAPAPEAARAGTPSPILSGRDPGATPSQAGGLTAVGECSSPVIPRAGPWGFSRGHKASLAWASVAGQDQRRPGQRSGGPSQQRLLMQTGECVALCGRQARKVCDVLQEEVASCLQAGPCREGRPSFPAPCTPMPAGRGRTGIGGGSESG